MPGIKIIIFVLCIFQLQVSQLSAQSDPALIYNSAVYLASQGYFSEAMKKFNETLTLDPESVASRLNLDVVQQAISGQIAEKAAMHYFHAIELGNSQKLDQKLSQLDSALSINPAFGLAYNEKGIVFANKMEYDSAIVNYDRAISQLSGYSEIYFNKALSCDKAGKYDEAVKSFQNFLEIAPDSYIVYIFYARTRIKEIQSIPRN